MNGRVRLTAVVVAVLLLGTGPVGAATGATTTAQSQSNPFAVQQDQIDADEVRMDVAVRPNGTAEWTLEFWVHLDDDESETAFESLQSDIRNDPDNYTRNLADRMDETVGAASDATGREMSADEFTVTTERQSLAREYGVVRYTFRWDGFAAVDGDELRAGDAIEGIYLDDGTRLLIEWPAEYERTSVTPEPDDERERAVIWRGGETDFVSGEPRVVVTAGGGLGTAALAGAAVVVAGLAATGAWWYRNRESTAGQAAGGEDAPAAGSGSESGAASGTATVSPTADGSAAASAAAVDTELLSNEEQVLQLLRNQGGRMKQQAVVEELDWTDAKTSKVVSGLREDGELESFRLGRENVLSLPDEDGEGTNEADGDGPA
ncbi:DUF7345 domain-containing protein [Natrinema salsiterrestre]|uniref:HTH iclR-type domain-containing protein n=1 Tax=Natrinema salsiterrestre TaxID=2950540 RepID=A0A9Q4Q4F5_9EURY|nr:hypothetical protein [Natrinema salsiterrestre]MDF9747168.1 hypothetical protein [Natrinema salsiterrestre]